MHTRLVVHYRATQCRPTNRLKKLLDDTPGGNESVTDIKKYVLGVSNDKHCTTDTRTFCRKTAHESATVLNSNWRQVTYNRRRVISNRRKVNNSQVRMARVIWHWGQTETMTPARLVTSRAPYHRAKARQHLPRQASAQFCSVFFIYVDPAL